MRAIYLSDSARPRKDRHYCRDAIVNGQTHMACVRCHEHTPPRPTSIASSLSRVEYNSMGERVVVRTPLENVDAFSARARQCKSRQPRNQRQEQPRKGANGRCAQTYAFVYDLSLRRLNNHKISYTKAFSWCVLYVATWGSGPSVVVGAPRQPRMSAICLPDITH